jgi:hypothetical protein
MNSGEKLYQINLRLEVAEKEAQIVLSAINQLKEQVVAKTYGGTQSNSMMGSALKSMMIVQSNISTMKRELLVK